MVELPLDWFGEDGLGWGEVGVSYDLSATESLCSYWVFKTKIQ